MTTTHYISRTFESIIREADSNQRATPLLGPRGVGKKTLVNRLQGGQPTRTLSGKTDQDVAIFTDADSY